jgi:serine/threonine protein kinase
VRGQKVICRACGLSFEVAREDVAVASSTSGQDVVGAKAAAATASATATASASATSEAASAKAAATPAPPAVVTSSSGVNETAASPNRPTVMAPHEDPESATVVRAALKVPGYELIHIIGRGGMGEVWRAKQVSLGREVAVKLLKPDLAKDTDFIKRFEKEAAALASLSHANIVQIIDRGQSEGIYFFAMEFVHGRSLRDLMAEHKLSPSDALKIVAQICNAIDYAHDHGVVHRDLKPENIMVSTDGQVKVADFGLAGIRDDKFNVTRSSMTMGTLNYMAPEQRKDAKGVDGRADLYSLGVMLYELITGEVPVGRFKLPSQKLTHLDARIDDIVAKALEPDPSARYQRASHIQKELEVLLSTFTLPASALPKEAPPFPASTVTPKTEPFTGQGSVNVSQSQQPANPEKPISSVVKHFHLAGRTVRAIFVGFMVFLGVGVILSNFFGIHLYTADSDGITIAKVVEIKNPHLRSDGGVLTAATNGPIGPTAAEPPTEVDTNADVLVGAEMVTDPSGITSLQSDLRPGNQASFIGLQGAWSTGPEGISGRVFDRLQSEGSRPRATLEEPSFRLKDFTTQVRVKVDPQLPAGYKSQKAPSASILFHGRELMLQLVMELGDAPAYRVIWKTVNDQGKTDVQTFGDPDFEESHPKALHEVQLRLVSKGGLLSVFADGQPILTKPVRMPDTFATEIGRVGVACEEATCTFSDFRAEGEAVQNRDLGDDVHRHTVAEAPEPPKPTANP